MCKLDLPAVGVQWGAYEAERLLEDSQTGLFAVDCSGDRRHHQPVGSGFALQSVGLQVGAEEESLVPCESEEILADQLCPLKPVNFLHFCAVTKNQPCVLPKMLGTPVQWFLTQCGILGVHGVVEPLTELLSQGHVVTRTDLLPCT
uniref:Uncharacterized protein n=1 Tax=Anguilla anguilla TaxID=7936 RepID=A0A0E9XF07_ANGAN